jgi:ABC-type Fe3+-siderophore transport system permease subunit
MQPCRLRPQEVTVTAFRASALLELSMSLTRGNETVYREALGVNATAGVMAATAIAMAAWQHGKYKHSMAATAGATAPPVDCE